MADRAHVIIKGRVQGVGFRYSTYHEAQRRGVTGWVRNLPGGDVEAEFEGSAEAVQDMVDWCRRGPRMARVTEVETHWESGEPEYGEFRVRNAW